MSMPVRPFEAILSGNRAPASGGIRRAEIEDGATHSGVSALDIWAFVVPAVSFVEIQLGGRLIVSEIIVLVMLPWLLGAPDRLRVPRWFLFLWGAWFVGQIVTDIVVGSAFADYSRGWGKILFTLTNFVAILTLVSTPRRARTFAVGLAVGGVSGYLIAPNIYAAGDPWKWALAFPVGLILAAGLSGRISLRVPWLPVFAFAAYGVLNLLLGFRSLGGLAMLTSGYLLLNGVVGRASQSARPSVPRAMLGVLFCLTMAFGVLVAYDAAASGGLLGADVQTKYYAQSGSLGVLVGGRSEALVSTQAIADSPVLGHGSWARDFKYVDLLSDRLSSLGYELGGGPSDVGLIPTHSYLLGAWVESGFLGGLFWLAVAVLAVWLILNLYAVRSAMAPLLVFSTMLLLWNIAFSPYGNSARLAAPYAIALCLLGLRSVLLGEGDSADARVGAETQR